jgi:hypothetical protein
MPRSDDEPHHAVQQWRYLPSGGAGWARNHSAAELHDCGRSRTQRSRGGPSGVHVYPSPKLLSAKVRVLVDFLAEKITNMKRASVTRPKRVRT